jgi:hypothetical protein
MVSSIIDWDYLCRQRAPLICLRVRCLSTFARTADLRPISLCEICLLRRHAADEPKDHLALPALRLHDGGAAGHAGHQGGGPRRQYWQVRKQRRALQTRAAIIAINTHCSIADKLFPYFGIYEHRHVGDGVSQHEVHLETGSKIKVTVSASTATRNTRKSPLHTTCPQWQGGLGQYKVHLQNCLPLIS